MYASESGRYAAAHKQALERFRSCSLKDMSRCSGYPLEENAICIDFLGQHFKVGYPNGDFVPAQTSDSELPIAAQLLILHYLTSLAEPLEVGELISFKELPGGLMYIKPFTGRAIDPLVRIFGTNPESLLEVAALLGGQSNRLGDVGITLRVFPRIPVTFVLWKADDEFPASGNILFDASAPAILPTEDFAVLASNVVLGMERIKLSLENI
ncbi:MAG: hypothetical protein APF84_12625 [Gracilibacter sp. BRH_c7a]|nr:MAG: hypothetical protein APF84_12625 [Gracilibacter sp. BRH_c7a]